MIDNSQGNLQIVLISAIVAFSTTLLTNYGSYQLEVFRRVQSEVDEISERQVKHAAPIWIAAYKYEKNLNRLEHDIRFAFFLSPISSDSQRVNLWMKEIEDSQEALDSIWTAHKFYLTKQSQRDLLNYMRGLYYKDNLLEYVWRAGSIDSLHEYSMNWADSLIDATRKNVNQVKDGIHRQLEVVRLNNAF